MCAPDRAEGSARELAAPDVGEEALAALEDGRSGIRRAMDGHIAMDEHIAHAGRLLMSYLDQHGFRT